ncbi:MAG TPA: 3-keto-5-aminohexanoate cleavage protein [Ramlibacter sp.]|uniref:3-keto-5-aminohexanoate cleavage protein n=1 Tax=Ramlibacter sp. TaxID=1917967 RepID=UPI002BB06BBD|nr:3-keto-5-aminohexanoate cleavage protein [Ramlibacter sp.]HVZ45723.1 3-keto-5-aminohexanoate cleavage protein [Ramlibacter sp.]
MSNKIIVTCAVTGSGEGFRTNPAVPITPEQIARAALEAESAGASIAHLHVRDPETGKGSGRVDLYQDVVERIRGARSQLILELSCGRGGTYAFDAAKLGVAGEGSTLLAAAERVAHVELLRPELCSLDVGSMNFEKLVYMNAPSELREMARRIRAAGTRPDLEVFELGHIEFGKQLIREGLVETPALFQVVLGARWGAPATLSTMLAMKDSLAGLHWSIADLGSGHPHRTISQGALLGGSVRVGLEDSIYIEPGVLASSNAQQVEQAVTQMRHLGYEVATPREARDMLGLKGP